MAKDLFEKPQQQNKSLSLFLGVLFICVAVFLFGLKTGRFKINKAMKSDELFVHSLMASFPKAEPYFLSMLGHIGGASEHAEDFYPASVDVLLDDGSTRKGSLLDLTAFLSDSFTRILPAGDSVRVYGQKHSSKDSEAFFETFFEGVSAKVTSEEANVINNVNGVILVERVLTFEISGEELNAALEVAHSSHDKAELHWIYETLKAYFDKMSIVTGKLYVNEEDMATGITVSAEGTEASGYFLLEISALINSLSDNVGYRFEVTKAEDCSFALNGSGKLDPKTGELDSEGVLLLGQEEFSIATDSLSVRSMSTDNASIMPDGLVILSSGDQTKSLKLDLGDDGKTREIIALEIENGIIETTAEVTVK